jgi:FixJ family two-component response regulator
MSRILLVDDDIGTVETLSAILRLEGFDVQTARSGGQALDCTRRWSMDLLLTDLRLPDFSGIDLLRCVRNEGVAAPAIIITAFGTIPSALQASRLGAVDYLEKPIFAECVINAVREGLTQACAPPERLPRGSAPAMRAATKWAELVLSAIAADDDVRSLREWGRILGMSRATVENRCEAAGVGAKASLDCARMLRALVHASRMNCDPDALLDCDPRTLRRLFSVAGLSMPVPGEVVASPTQFLDSQRFVVNRLAVEELRRVVGHESTQAPRAAGPLGPNGSSF